SRGFCFWISRHASLCRVDIFVISFRPGCCTCAPVRDGENKNKRSFNVDRLAAMPRFSAENGSFGPMHISLVIDSANHALVTFARRSHPLVGRGDAIGVESKETAAVCPVHGCCRAMELGHQVACVPCPKFS